MKINHDAIPLWARQLTPINCCRAHFRKRKVFGRIWIQSLLVVVDGSGMPVSIERYFSPRHLFINELLNQRFTRIDERLSNKGFELGVINVGNSDHWHWLISL